MNYKKTVMVFVILGVLDDGRRLQSMNLNTDALPALQEAATDTVQAIKKTTSSVVAPVRGAYRRRKAGTLTPIEKELLLRRKLLILEIQPLFIPGEQLQFFVPLIAKYFRTFLIQEHPELLHARTDQFLKHTQEFVPREARVLDLRRLGIENISEIEPLMEKLGGEVEKIDYLYLDHNYLTKLPTDAFKKFKGVKVINLTDNRIKAVAPRAFANLPELTVIDASKNDIDVKNFSPDACKGDHKLKALILASNKVTFAQRGALQNKIQRSSNLGPETKVYLVDAFKVSVDFIKMAVMTGWIPLQTAFLYLISYGLALKFGVDALKAYRVVGAASYIPTIAKISLDPTTAPTAKAITAHFGEAAQIIKEQAEEDYFATNDIIPFYEFLIPTKHTKGMVKKKTDFYRAA